MGLKVQAERDWAEQEMAWALFTAIGLCDEHLEQPTSSDHAAVAVGLFASRVADKQIDFMRETDQA